MVFGVPRYWSWGWARKSMVVPGGMVYPVLRNQVSAVPLCLAIRTHGSSIMLQPMRISTPPRGSLPRTSACTHCELPRTFENVALNGESAKLQYCVVASVFGAGIQL